MEEQKRIKISVRNLVEFILREGDIDNRVAGSMDKDLMLQGSRIHRKIQRRMGEDYRAEVPLKLQIPCEGFLLQIEGRADGIQSDGTETVIDEIKGVLRDLNHLEAPVPVHLAQAKCYAYIYASQNSLERIAVQMTYCNLESEEIKRFVQEYECKELEEWFHGLVRQYEKWARFEIEWKEVRDASILEQQFPFPYREGQRNLVASVYRTIEKKKKLFIQAPTGVGKTMAVIFPAIRAVGGGMGEKLFYLTAKTITRTVAEQAFGILKKNGLRYKVITLTAKEKICFLEEAQCNPEACPYAKGHFDRVNEAVFELISSEDDLSRERLEQQAQKYQVCPFEMALDVSLWADAVICDYNYVFDPNAHLKRFFSEGGKGGYLFLIDEAHNLVERGREMYSAVLYKEDLLEVRRLVKTQYPRLAKRLNECNSQFLELKRECENYRILENVSHIVLKLMNIMSEMEEFLEEEQDQELRTQVLDVYFQIRNFLNIHEILDENYVIYSELERGGRFKVKLFCVNPSVNLQTYLQQGNSTIFFSATLLPVQYYRQLLSVEKDDYAVYAQSSFPKENKLLWVGKDVSTRYTNRSEQTYERYARYIMELVKSRSGNYMVFFPSYRFLEDVYFCFQRYVCEPEMECIVQSQFMTEEARESFLEAFEKEREGSLVAFCVMGGIFSEGIDLTEERLVGAVIAGTGLPQVCNEREILKEFFNNRGEDGFSFAYLYPGMNKVLQSAGRVIRTEHDRGVILLLDDRFCQQQYYHVFPREWDGWKTGTLKQAGEEIRAFWESP